MNGDKCSTQLILRLECVIETNFEDAKVYLGKESVSQERSDDGEVQSK
jgi:hypothetical protein